MSSGWATTASARVQSSRSASSGAGTGTGASVEVEVEVMLRACTLGAGPDREHVVGPGGYGRAMSYRLSRFMSTATAGYGVFALVSPQHLGTALEVDPQDRAGMDLLAQTYGVRDL